MNLKKITKWIYSHQFEVIVGIVSLITLVVGIIAIGWISIPIVLVLDSLILFGPELYQKIMKKLGKKTKDGENEMKKKKEKKEKPTKKGKKKRGKILAIILTVILAGLVIGCVGAGIGFWYIASHAPSFNPDELYSHESTIVYADDGETIIATLGAEKREKIEYKDLPEVFIDALIATEDSRYFQHNGFDLPRFAKAFVGQVLGNSNAGGASTITMQVSKNTYTSTEAHGIEGIIRKFTDIYLSIFEIEKKYSKEEIIEFYINNNLLGGNNYGVEQASLTYFGKSAKELNLSEAALLAGMFQSPNAYNPLLHPQASEKRRNIVLKLMVRHGYISQAEADAAAKIPVSKLTSKSKGKGDDTEYQGFIDTIVSEVKKDTGKNPYTTSMKIYSTMKIDKQNIVNGVMKGETFSWENGKVQAGIVVLDSSNGEIKAIGTNRDYTASGLLNHATFENQTKRQIGSTAKPLYDYGPAIEYNNASPAMQVVDEPYQYSGGTKISNFDGAYQGLESYRKALAGSRNVPALKVFQTVKKSNVIEFVKGLGLSPEISGNTIHEAHAIGGYTGESPLTVAAAYATVANKGVYNSPHSYRKIVYRDTNEEYTKELESHKVMSEDTAYILQDMLLSVAQSGLGSYGNVNGWAFGAKTGTSNFSQETKKANKLADDAVNDRWIVGNTDEYAMAIWYGYDKIYSDAYTHFANSEHLRMFNQLARQIWTRSIKHEMPSGVIRIELESGAIEPILPSPTTPANERYTEYYKKGSEPTEVSTRYAQLENVKNLKAESSKGFITLSWTPVYSKWLDKEYLRKYFGPYFKNNDYLETQVSIRYNWEVSNTGIIVYDIYEVDEDNKYTKIGTTSESEYTFEPTKAGEVTYVVKTSHKVYKGADSNGVIIKKAVSGTASYSVTVTSDTITEGTTYDYKNKVIVSSKTCSLYGVTIKGNNYPTWDKANEAIKNLPASTYNLMATYTCGPYNKKATDTGTLTIKKASTSQ